ncbi:MAG: metallophosphoesterase family protein [Brachybacterium sp.]|nr:metallophosphoesterase family protein [Brachybacterium sp.]
MTLLRGHAPGVTVKDDVTLEQISEHDEHIIASWNSVVARDDTVWHLGDLTLKRSEEIAGILQRLNGRLRIVLGNHDRAHPRFGERSIEEQKELLEAGIEYVCTEARITIAGNGTNRWPILLSHFPYMHDNEETGRLSKFTQWLPRDTGEVLLHGHTHAAERSQPGRPRQIHVGWDAWGRPVAEEELRHVAVLGARDRSR